MKKVISAILAAMAIGVCGTSAFAAAPADTKVLSVIVSGKTADLSALPQGAYKSGDTVMVPLRTVCEGLGYSLDYNAETGAITVSDAYIQEAVLFSGSAEADFTGKLQIIDMTRKIQNAAPTVIYGGYTYVPADFFKEFFNDVEISAQSVSISPSTCEIQAESAS